MTAGLTLTQQKAVSPIHPDARMGAATLAVADLSRSIDFYTRVLGMQVLNQGGSTTTTATVGSGATPLLHLREIPNAVPQPDYSTGLYHVAILTPSRPDLGRVLLNLARTQYQVSGFADHLVSEAIYLNDPDGNGLELYRDRPRHEWGWENGTVKMASDPIDLDGIVASVDDPDAPFTGIADGTVIGHMHLRVGNIPQAEAFYHGVLGFDIVASWHGASFVSAGGYHHHLGLNTWHSRGASPAPENSVGLRRYEIVLPDEEARGTVIGRLDAENIPHTTEGEAVLVDDPWRNQIALTTASAG